MEYLHLHLRFKGLLSAVLTLPLLSHSPPRKACTWHLGSDGTGTLAASGPTRRYFVGTVTGLDTGPNGNVVTVNCSILSNRQGGGAAGLTTSVVYRAVPDIGNERFPKIGNLWGSSNFKNKPLEYAASRISL